MVSRRSEAATRRRDLLGDRRLKATHWSYSRTRDRGARTATGPIAVHEPGSAWCRARGHAFTKMLADPKYWELVNGASDCFIGGATPFADVPLGALSCSKGIERAVREPAANSAPSLEQRLATFRCFAKLPRELFPCRRSDSEARRQAPSEHFVVGEMGRKKLQFQRPKTLSSIVVVAHLDLQDLAESGRRKAEAEVGDINVAVRPERHGGRQRQAGSDDIARSRVVHAHDAPGARRGERVGRRVLEHVEPAASVERDAENGREPRGVYLDMASERDLENLRAALDDRKGVQVADVERTSVEDHGRGHDVPLTRGDVDHAMDRPSRRRPLEVAVVRFEHEELVVHGDHAVWGAVRLKIERLRVLDRMALVE